MEAQDESEIQIQRLVIFANFLHEVRMTYPVPEPFVITKNQKGYKIDFDNFSFSWVIGLLPLVFGNHWAYSSTERMILKQYPELTTFRAIQVFFGISNTEYFQLFVAYFQDESYNGKLLRHDMCSEEDIAY